MAMAVRKAALPHSVDLGAALVAGIVAGVVFIVLDVTLVPLLGLGSPWEPVRMIAAIALGPSVLPPPATFDLRIFLVAMMVHFSLSSIYSVVRVVVVEGWAQSLTPLSRGLYGLVIYLVNFYGFTRFFPWFAEARGWVSILVHVAWGMVLPIAYETLTRPGGRKAVAAPG
ncbi:MAG: hypothetical protein AB2A00_18445 [Myxococcota bacterium]